MKKNYFSFLIAALMLFVAMPASAQVKDMSELFGKYKFTATITPTEAGKQYTDLWQSECEVIITKGANGAPATVKGLLGNGADQTVANFYGNTNQFEVVNPNPNYGLLSQNPYIGVADMTLENLQMYNMVYNFNPETKEITISDFSIAEFTWPGGVMTGNVLAEVSNVKMELIEAEKVEIPNIEGEWKFKPYSMGYVQNDTTFVYEFKMNLVATDETYMAYDATFEFEGFNSFTLPATFNGAMLTIPFDSLYLDAENKIRFGIAATKSTPENVFVKQGQFSFSYSNKTIMWQNDKIYIRQEGVDTLGNAVAPIVQAMTYGWIKRDDPDAYKWDGTYEVSVKYFEDYDTTDSIEFPKNFEMVVEESAGSYAIRSFLGYDCGLTLAANEDGKSATINVSFAYLIYLGEIEGDWAYYTLTDVNGQPTSLTVTVNEDGSLSIDDFTVSYTFYGAGVVKCLASMSQVSITKKGVETAIEDEVVESKEVVEGIFDLLGRKLDAITAPGLYIVNGKKVVIK